MPCQSGDWEIVRPIQLQHWRGGSAELTSHTFAEHVSNQLLPVCSRVGEAHDAAQSIYRESCAA